MLKFVWIVQLLIILASVIAIKFRKYDRAGGILITGSFIWALFGWGLLGGCSKSNVVTWVEYCKLEKITDRGTAVVQNPTDGFDSHAISWPKNYKQPAAGDWVPVQVVRSYNMYGGNWLTTHEFPKDYLVHE